MFARVLRHLCWPEWRVRRHFTPAVLAEVQRAISTTEREHRGEVRFAVENALDPGLVLAGVTARQRALQAFAQLQVWDTEDNTGVLVYVLFADHAVEIVADRGIARRVPQSQWDALCEEVRTAYHQARYRDGSLRAIEAAATLLRQHFPATGARRNELPDQPVLL